MSMAMRAALPQPARATPAGFNRWMSMRRPDEAIQVVGAGPAGLAAAITLGRSRRRVVVHEARPCVGHRFGGDLHGLENCTTTADVLDQLRELGITTDFAQLASTQVTAFDAWGGTHRIRGRHPLFYLVVRGLGEGSLDSALLKLAREVGVDVRFSSRKTSIEGPGVLATGPKAADAIAVGYHFETDMSDGIWMVLDDDVAPQGYSYLLVMQGCETVKSCMFSGLKQQRTDAKGGKAPTSLCAEKFPTGEGASK